MKRRDFLRSSGWFVVGAALAGLPGAGCGDNVHEPELPEPPRTYQFPQGVASGDPRDRSVVLWTRIQKGTELAFIPFKLQVATDPGFGTIVVDQEVTASADTDHTVRVLVTGLQPATEYHYRFMAGSDSIAGRTRTAPEAGADVQVNLAWVSCQDYAAGTYGAYRQMISEDEARAPADQIHFVVHLGDVIYETRADGFQTAIDDQFQPISLVNADGKPRAVSAFPSGGGTRGGNNFANTIEDYRHLYRTFLSDPDSQAARARWPFVSVWDDHEFTNDSWQCQSNYAGTSLDEGEQVRKLAASQAWFEYVPAHLTGAAGVPGVASDAKDFTPAPVSDAMFTPPNNDNFVDEPNNVAALGAMTIYRSLRFGKHLDLVMTDERSYRSDHAIPEEFTTNQLFFDPRAALPLPVVNTFDQGRTANGGSPPATVLGLPNARAASPPGTMLGARQKAWWKATMKGSDATWKLWGNEVMLTRVALQQVTGQPFDRVLTGDAWDGYPTERNELMTFLRTESIRNVVALSGDLHATFASVIMDNFDSSVVTPQPVACELLAPGISSNSLFSFFEGATRMLPAGLRGLITVDASTAGGPSFVENFNLWLLHGTNAAGTYAATRSLSMAMAAADPTVNPHLRYVDTNSQGYGYAKVTGTKLEAALVTINRPISRSSGDGPGIKRVAQVVVPKDNPAGMTVTVTGTKPFPLT